MLKLIAATLEQPLIIWTLKMDLRPVITEKDDGQPHHTI